MICSLTKMQYVLLSVKKSLCTFQCSCLIFVDYIKLLKSIFIVLNRVVYAYRIINLLFSAIRILKSTIECNKINKLAITFVK